jgi:hypothetical protein
LYGKLLVSTADNTSYINPEGDEKLLNTTLYDLGYRSKVTEALDKRTKLRDELAVGLAIGNKVYIGQFGKDRMTPVHETFHVLYPASSTNMHISHVFVAAKLGIRTREEYSEIGRRTKKNLGEDKSDGIASGDMDYFLNNDCDASKKPPLPPSARP